jgi:hypothetical protein
MPRAAQLVINDETAVYKAWDVKPNSLATFRFTHITL